MLNLFVGVVIDNFNEMKKKLVGSAFLTVKQKSWIDARRFALKDTPLVVPKMPTN